MKNILYRHHTPYTLTRSENHSGFRKRTGIIWKQNAVLKALDLYIQGIFFNRLKLKKVKMTTPSPTTIMIIIIMSMIVVIMTILIILTWEQSSASILSFLRALQLVLPQKLTGSPLHLGGEWQI